MLLFIDCKKMPTMTVLDDLAVGDLDVFQHFDLVVDDGEDLKPRGETHCKE